MLSRHLAFCLMAALCMLSSIARADSQNAPSLGVPRLRLRGLVLPTVRVPDSNHSGPRLLPAPAAAEVSPVVVREDRPSRRARAAFALAMVSAVTAGILTPFVFAASYRCAPFACGITPLSVATVVPVATFAGWAGLRAVGEPMSHRRRTGTCMMYLGGLLTTVSTGLALALLISS